MKRICVLSDGTWQSAESEEPTNILKLALNILPEDGEKVAQVVLYDDGIGSSDSTMDRIVGGATGAGIDLNIQQLYKFLAMNYVPGDEVYMFGFSRGAYTVRSLAGLIYYSGLISRNQLDFAKEAYDLYRQRQGGGPDSQLAVNFRKEHGDRIDITLLACFDTVGALGIPRKFDLFGLSKKYRFHDTQLSDYVKNAIHMVSIDEDRSGFKPTLMETHEDNKEQLTQLYFWGTHSGVGGGIKRERACSALTLNFLVTEMKKRGLGLCIAECMCDETDRGAFDVELTPKTGFSFTNMIIRRLTGTSAREIGSADLIHPLSRRRYKDVESWRPPSLQPLKDAILEKVK